MDPITIGVGLAGLLGGIFGGGSSSEETSGLRLTPQSDLERNTLGSLGRDFSSLREMAGQAELGANATNPLFRAAGQSNQDLISMLSNLRQTGGLPGQQDIEQSRGMTSQLFAGQREQMRQAFAEQLTGANRDAARMGRSINDPILRAKLAQQQTNQFSQLAANETAETARVAMGLPGQRLQYQQMLTDFQGGLATQAFKNRAAILEMGSGLLQNERNFRVSTAERYGNQSGEQGTGLSRAISGGIAGLGAGLGMQSSLSQIGTTKLAGNTTNLASLNPSTNIGFAPTAPGMGVGLGSLGPWRQ